jgi:hypothetical protein
MRFMTLHFSLKSLRLSRLIFLLIVFASTAKAAQCPLEDQKEMDTNAKIVGHIAVILAAGGNSAEDIRNLCRSLGLAGQNILKKVEANKNCPYPEEARQKLIDSAVRCPGVTNGNPETLNGNPATR